ncbi:hypothetical protein BHE74_00051995, partial [Ensete ventricosum]
SCLHVCDHCPLRQAPFLLRLPIASRVGDHQCDATFVASIIAQHCLYAKWHRLRMATPLLRRGGHPCTQAIIAFA